MCGIVARLNFEPDRSIDPRQFQQMTDTLHHRGPDDQGVWIDGPIALGHRRLSIIDLSPAGKGPMRNHDGSLVISFNGEVYNYQEIRQVLEGLGHTFRTGTDTEVVLCAYAQWGVDCLRRFNGMFAFCLWDNRKRRLFVARDRFGVKPLVYYHDDQRFICASEIKAVLAADDVPNEPDPVGLHHYLSLMNVPAPYTIYRNIRKLLPGHYMLIEGRRIRTQRWWQLEPGDERTDSEEKVLDTLDELMNDSVRLRLISDAPLGAFLSGGVDSSLVASIAAKQLGDVPLRTFSVAFSGQSKYDESVYARRVAGDIHSDHTEIDLQADFLQILPTVAGIYDEPFAVSSSLALYAMARETSKYVKAVLTGDGGDEVFGGYFRHTIPDARFDRLAKLPFSGLREFSRFQPGSSVGWRMPSWLKRPRQLAIAMATPDKRLRDWRFVQLLQVLNESEKFSLYTEEWAAELRACSDFQTTDEFLNGFFPERAPNRLARWLHFDINSSLADEMLAKVDKATMACSLEARNPFLDYRLVEYALSLPADMVANSRQSKRLLKRLAERYVTPDVLYRPKQGFTVPLAAWFRDRIPGILNDALDTQKLADGRIFRSEVVREMIARHQKDSKSDFAHAILNIACLGLWSSHVR